LLKCPAAGKTLTANQETPLAEIEVAVPTPLAQTFTYTYDSDIPAGTRVLVPFGPRKVVGVSLGRPEGVANPAISLKPVHSVIDSAPVYSPVLLGIARWISTYYMHPIGEVLRTMLPASSTKVVRELYELTPEGEKERTDTESRAGQMLVALFGKKKSSVAAVTARKKVKRVSEEQPELFAGIDLRSLSRSGFIARSKGTIVRARGMTGFEPATFIGEQVATDRPLEVQLTARQQEVVDTVVAEGISQETPQHVFLLHGVTGSGKTEVYIRLIQAALASAADQNGQALVMVPEISLTPQMTRVFDQRFPGKVAVVHSAMTDTDRWDQLNRIRSGEAVVLIGPRSAVFAPFQNLRLILVDEEHDGSYKQTTGLTYNGRDVAVLRARMEKAVVVLGSATPSMESYNNALTGRYRLLEMPERATGRPLPDVEVISAPRSFKASVAANTPQGPMSGDVVAEDNTDVPIDDRIISELRQNLADGRQSIVLVNRRGYAYYLFSLDTKKAVQCPQCSISMTLHARSTRLRCHYCDYTTTSEKVMADFPGETFISVGYGSQKAEDCLQQKLPGARIVRLDSDILAQRDVLPQTMAKFRSGEIDILVGTQILAKGHDFPNVTLIVILEVDQLLGLPDFRAGERTFQLVVQAAGRAGRADLAGKVLIQTLRPQHPVVSAAVNQDYHTFAERELDFRKMQAYPPFQRMIAVEFNGTDKVKLQQFCQRMEAWFDQIAAMKPELVKTVRILGPAVPPIETIRNRHRRSVIFSSGNNDALRSLVGMFVQTYGKLPGDIRMRIDVDPQSLI
jgi:primosomal protein N' (replication factor Y)